jgi:hypothetical protein
MSYLRRKVLGGRGPSIDAIPVLVGGKVLLSGKVYAQGQLGVTFLDANRGNNFTYASGIGFRFNAHLDGLLKYQGWNLSNSGSENVHQLCVRMAYTF